MPSFHHHDTVIAYDHIGSALDTAKRVIVWGHGWGQGRFSLHALAKVIPGQDTAHILVDFPGFGESPMPTVVWSVQDYADAMAALIMALVPGQKIIWVGHSFGGRVGLRLAAAYPDRVAGLFLIASHGMKPRRTLWQHMKIKVRIGAFKVMKNLIPLWGGDIETLRSTFGSVDYRQAGALRPIFVKVIGDDVSELLPTIKCPVHFVVGAHDQETPPRLGQAMASLIDGAMCTVLPDQDHYSVIGDGRHPVLKILMHFMQKVDEA